MGHEPHYHPFPLGAGIYARTSYLFDGIVIPLQYHIDGKLLQIICEKRTAITQDPSPHSA